MKDKTKILFGALFLFGILTLGSNVSAATIFTDNFNDYTFGPLNGQGGWSAYPAFSVSDGITKEGSKSVFGFNFASPILATKSGALLNDGKITVYVRRFDANQPGVLSLTLKEGTNTKVEIRGNYGGNAKFQYVDVTTGSYVNFGTPFSFGTWYAIQIQWRSSDHFVRYNIDGGPWTPWVLSSAPWTSGLDTVELEVVNSIFFDTIQENLIGAEKIPVLIVPGLTGTELKDGDELLWTDLGRMITDVDDSFLDKLSFSPGLISSFENISTLGVISSKSLGPFNFDYTAGLIEELTNQGYSQNENLFTLPYDWRYGVTGAYPNGQTNEDLLSQKIADILVQTGADEVDVIAHSMGGLIVKQYVKNHLADNHIGKAVFVGVPNTGAPKSVKTLLEGDNLGMFFVSQEEIKKIAKNMPGIYDLLPSQQYYDAKGSYIRVIDQGITGINAIVKDLTHNEAISFLIDEHDLNAQAQVNAESLHTQDFDIFDMRTVGVDMYAIDGCKSGTLGKITEVRSENIFGQAFITYKKPDLVPGDGIVPLESATNLPIDQNKKYYALKGEHGKLMSQDGARQQIVNIISGSDLAVDSETITQDINECKLNGKAISIYSPIDVHVTDQDGNVLGLADDGSVFNEIPNAAFEIMGESFDSAQGKHKFLYLPTDNGQVYDIQIQGTGTGSYTINSQDIVDGEATYAEVFSNLPVTSSLTGEINLGIQTILTIQQDQSAPTEAIFPSATVLGEEAQDILPPEVTGQIIGTQDIEGFYRSDVVFEITAIDTGSGVLHISHRVDAGPWQTGVGAVTIATEGQHSISFFATDNAGNNSLVQQISFTIDKIAPEVVVGFDAILLDLKFSGIDNISTGADLVVIDNDDVITIKDQAGNVTEIRLKNRNRRVAMKAEIASLKYNGILADISKNTMRYSWSVDKAKKLVSLYQYVKAQNNYSVLAVFDGKNTKVSGVDSLGIISKVFSGLKTLQVSTYNGNFTWSY